MLNDLENLVLKLHSFQTRVQYELKSQGILTEDDIFVIFSTLNEITVAAKKALGQLSIIFQKDETISANSFYLVIKDMASCMKQHHAELSFVKERISVLTTHNKPFSVFLRSTFVSSGNATFKGKKYLELFYKDLSIPFTFAPSFLKWGLVCETTQAEGGAVGGGEEGDKVREMLENVMEKSSSSQGLEAAKEFYGCLKGWDGISFLISPKRICATQQVVHHPKSPSSSISLPSPFVGKEGGRVVKREVGEVSVNGEVQTHPIAIVFFDDCCLFVDAKTFAVKACVIYRCMVLHKPNWKQQNSFSFSNCPNRESHSKIFNFGGGGEDGEGGGKDMFNNSVVVKYTRMEGAEESGEEIERYLSHHRVFGIPLELVLQADNAEVPWVLTNLAEFLYQSGGLNTEGIFRKGGQQDLVNDLQLNLDLRNTVNLSNVAEKNPHLAAEVLKIWFRLLPEPIVTWSLREKLLNSMDEDNAIDDDDDDSSSPLPPITSTPSHSPFTPHQLNHLQKYVHKLPPKNKVVLQYILGFLETITKFESTNKMTFENVAIIFGPLLLSPSGPSSSSSSSLPVTPDVSGPQSVVSALILHNREIFGEMATSDYWVEKYGKEKEEE